MYNAFLYFPLRGIGQGLSLDRAGNTALVFPVYISQPMFTLVLGVSVLDVLEYLIGENAKWLVLQNWVPKCDMEPKKLTTPNLVKFVCVLSL